MIDNKANVEARLASLYKKIRFYSLFKGEKVLEAKGALMSEVESLRLSLIELE